MEADKMNKFIGLIGIVILISITGCTPVEKPIGGETDEHGCMLMAGYTWCESKQMCLREWKEKCPEGGELIGASCGTVTPGYNDECCARKMIGAIKPSCVGEWKWVMPEARCKFICTTE